MQRKQINSNMWNKRTVQLQVANIAIILLRNQCEKVSYLPGGVGPLRSMTLLLNYLTYANEIFKKYCILMLQWDWLVVCLRNVVTFVLLNAKKLIAFWNSMFFIYLKLNLLDLNGFGSTWQIYDVDPTLH